MSNFISQHPYAAALVRIGKIAIEKEDDRALDAYFSTRNYVIHRPDGDSSYDQLKSYFAALRGAFDDLKVDREQIMVEGQHVAARTVFSGVFARTFTQSPLGELEPNGRAVRWIVHNLFRYDEEGRLAEEWIVSDTRMLVEQLTAK